MSGVTSDAAAQSEPQQKRMPKNRGDTSLHIATANGRTETVKMLINGGSILNSRSDSDGFTPLMRACEHDQLSCAILLLDAGASITAKDQKGHTPLHWALICSEQITEELLERGAKPCSWKCLKCKANLRKRNESGEACEPCGDSDHPPKPLSPRMAKATPMPPPKPLDAKVTDKVELDRYEISMAKHIVSRDPDDPSWISFSSAEAPWTSMSVNPEMKKVFDEMEAVFETSKALGDKEMANEWMDRAEGLLLAWILKGITRSEKRAAQFRSLGRGWIFVQLSTLGINKMPSFRLTNSRTSFKWWFEGVPRVLRNRHDDFAQYFPDITDEVSKWTSGYDHRAELVFVVRGFYPGKSVISRRKVRADSYLTLPYLTLPYLTLYLVPYLTLP